jgi:Tol biopolymer transport system component
MFPLLTCLLLNPEAADWQKLEATHLKNVRQLTHDFVRAGEGYFSPDGRQIIFQAEERNTGNPFYQIFVMDLQTGRYRRVSPGIGKTTCSYFRPDGKKIIFASSHLDPDATRQYAEEYRQREEDRRAGRHRRYKWDFDPYMQIFEADPDGGHLKQLTHSRGYNAEGSYSPDGRQIVFCSSRDGNRELYIMDADGSHVRQFTHTPGCYNGGPFFSPDGKRVVFRSDRKKEDALQLYVINVDGTGERALTDDLTGVFWGPYWYKDSRHVIYAGADHSNPTVRPNYDLWWLDVDASVAPLKGFEESAGRNLRLTYFPGADVLPVFSGNGKRLMWTSTRTADHSSQLFLADFIAPKGE